MTTNVVVETSARHKVYFPRSFFPFHRALRPRGLAIGFVVLAIFTLAYGIRPRSRALASRAAGPRLFTALGVGLWLSALNALYRDVRYVIPFLVQFWMFASPVAYASSLSPSAGAGLRPQSHAGVMTVSAGHHRPRPRSRLLLLASPPLSLSSFSRPLLLQPHGVHVATVFKHQPSRRRLFNAFGLDVRATVRYARSRQHGAVSPACWPRFQAAHVIDAGVANATPDLYQTFPAPPSSDRAARRVRAFLRQICSTYNANTFSPPLPDPRLRHVQCPQ